MVSMLRRVRRSWPRAAQVATDQPVSQILIPVVPIGVDVDGQQGLGGRAVRPRVAQGRDQAGADQGALAAAGLAIKEDQRAGGDRLAQAADLVGAPAQMLRVVRV